MVATFNFWLVALSYAVAVAAAYAALCSSPRLKRLSLPLAHGRKAAAALVMGLGLAGLYYSGRAMVGCALEMQCMEGNRRWLVALWLAVMLLFALTSLIVVWFDALLDEHSQRLLDSLEHNQDLDRSVKERTASLMEANLSLVREVSERKATQEQLARNAAELNRSNKDLEHFAYVASHDLQAPLRGIIGFSQLLEGRYASKLDAEGQEYLGFISSSAAQMQLLISGVLAFSRVGQQNQPKEAVNLDEVLADASQRLFASIQERKAVITHGALPVVQGVRIELVQLFQNLLSNALKFQPGEAPRVEVSVAEAENGFWRLSVRDYGIGVPPEHSERIFQIFQRLHTSDTYEGTGIGLALCQKIVQHHGGRIWVESTPGQGSCFHFTLPAAAG